MINTPTTLETTRIRKCPSPPMGVNWDPKLQYSQPCEFVDRYVIGYVTLSIGIPRPGRIVYHWIRQELSCCVDPDDYGHGKITQIPWPNDIPNDIEDAADVSKPELHSNVFVVISRCRNCGAWSLSWRRTAETEDLDPSMLQDDRA